MESLLAGYQSLPPTSLQFIEWPIKVKYMFEHTSMWHCKWNVKTGHEVKRVPGLCNSNIWSCSKCWLFQQKYQRIEIYEMNHINFEPQLKIWKWTWSWQFSLNGLKNGLTMACSPVGLAQWIEHCVQSSQRSGFASQSSLNFHLLRLFIQLWRIKIMFTFIQISNIFSSVMFMLLFITFSTMVVTI